MDALPISVMAVRNQHLFSEVIREILEQKRKSISARSFYNLEFYLTEKLNPFFGKMIIGEITPNTVEKYVSEVKSVDENRNTRNDLGFLKSVLNYAFTEGYSEKFIRIKQVDADGEPGVYVEKWKFKKLWKHCRSDDDLRLQLGMGYYMGMRKSEICHLVKSHVKKMPYRDGRYVRHKYVVCLPAKKTKAKKVPGRKIVVHPKLVRILLKKLREPGDVMFPSNVIFGQAIHSNNMPWRFLRKRAGLEGVRFHDLRHTCATNLVAAGAHVIVLRQILGMSLKTAARYTHLPLKSTSEFIEEAFKLAA